MSVTASEITWLVRLLEELDVTNLKHVTLNCDNQLAMYIAHNPVFHECTKHITIDYHFTREKVLKGLLHLSYVRIQEQLVDSLTKIIPSAQFNYLKSKFGMVAPLPSL